MSTNQIANPDNNTLIVLGATSVLVIGGLAYYFITNKSNEVPKTSQKEIDELMNDQKHPKERRKKNKKNLVQAKNQEENKEEKGGLCRPVIHGEYQILVVSSSHPHGEDAEQG